MSNQASDNPWDRAKAVLKKLAITSSPIPIEKVARALGAQVRFSPFDDELSGMIYIKNGIPIIGVNSLHHPNRQRFTIAHELGHLELHREIITSSIHVDKVFPALMRDATSAKGEDRIEIEANQFAAELLMPQTIMAQELAGKQFDIEDDLPLEEIAKKFRVSKQALELRIRSIINIK
jgi:Zn-dependent peptidase ImmA (M78 family)